MLRKFYSDARVLLLEDIFVRLKALVILPVIAHRFGALDYGVWSQVQVLVTATAPFLVLGTDSGFVRYAAGAGTVEQRRQFCAWVVYLAVVGALIAGILIVFRGFFARVFFEESGEYPAFIVLAAGNLLLLAALNAARKWFLVVNRPQVTAVVGILQAMLGVLAVIATVVFKLDVYQFVSMSLASDFVATVWIFTVFLHGYGWSTPQFQALRPMLRFGLPLIPAGFAMWGLNLMDRLFLVKYHGVSQVGIYSFAYAIGAMAAPLLSRPFRAMYPSLATSFYNQGRTEDHQRIFNYSAGTVIILTVPAIAGLQLVSHPLMALVAPAEFAVGANVMAIVMVGYVLNILSSYYATHLGLLHRQQWHTVALMVAFIANLGLNLLLIPPYGLYGAAVATLASFVVEFAITFAMASAKPVVRSDFLFALKVLASTAVMAAVVMGAKTTLPADHTSAIVELVVTILVGTISYAATVWILGVVPREAVIGYLRTRSTVLNSGQEG